MVVAQHTLALGLALGTFVGNSAERTDHSTTIDHNVAMMLAQLINDGSPMVRKVCGASSVAKVRACGCPCVAVLMCLELSPHRASCPTYVHHSILTVCRLLSVFIAPICSLEGAELTGSTDFYHQYPHAWASCC